MNTDVDSYQLYEFRFRIKAKEHVTGLKSALCAKSCHVQVASLSDY